MPLRVVRTPPPASATYQAALARTLLMRASNGDLPATLHLYRPVRTVAFGRLDALRPGFPAAVDAARALRYEPALRAVGGHAAAYHDDALVLDHVVPGAEGPAGLRRRFVEGADLLVEALRSLGVDARVGELPGEYCAGAFSVNGAGRVKLCGTAQRVVRGGALFSAVVLVGGSGALREVLTTVYDRLGLAWDPATAGAVSDLATGIGVDDVRDAVLAAYARRSELVEIPLDEATLAGARELEPSHRPA